MKTKASPTGREQTRELLRRMLRDVQRGELEPHVEITLEMIARMEEITRAGGDIAAYIQDVITMREAGARRRPPVQ